MIGLLRLYGLPTVFLVVAMILFVKGGGVKRDIEVARSQMIIKDAVETVKTEVVTAADVITARTLIEALAKANGLDLQVAASKNEIVITTSTPKAPVTDGQEATGGNTKGVEDKLKTLGNYKGINSFLSAIASLPYRMEYKSFCIGVDCPSAIEMSISMGKPTGSPN